MYMYVVHELKDGDDVLGVSTGVRVDRPRWQYRLTLRSTVRQRCHLLDHGTSDCVKNFGCLGV